MKDLYKTLGVAESADDAAIKKAYRKLAKEYHPDVTGDDKKKTERFKEINEAYAVLGDAEEAQGIRSPQARPGAPRRHARRLRCRRVRAHLRRSRARRGRRRVQRRLRRGGHLLQPVRRRCGGGGRATQSWGRVRPRQSRGADAIGQLPVTFAEAALGTKRTHPRRAAAARSRSPCRPASRTAGACASPARGRPRPPRAACPATCTSTWTCGPTRTCVAPATTSSSTCRSRSPRRCSAPRSRSRRSTAR